MSGAPPDGTTFGIDESAPRYPGMTRMSSSGRAHSASKSRVKRAYGRDPSGYKSIDQHLWSPDERRAARIRSTPGLTNARRDIRG
jgi:hypothetical protein